MRIRLIPATGLLLLATACSGGDARQSPPPTTATTAPGPADLSKQIPGTEFKQYRDSGHIRAPQRVAYDQSPPFGGYHDASWAACNGVVYTKAVRNENMVHSLEHGAVWIAYNPETLAASAVEALKEKVAGVPYLMLSPYPGLDERVSLQSWGHRLKVQDPSDPRFDQFVTLFKQNESTHPEPGATCDNPTFDQDNPPPFESSPAPAGSAPVGS